MSIDLKASPRVKPSRQTALSGVSSVLRLAARGRQASSAAPGWLDGLTRAMRSAGPGHGARPLHAVLAGGEFAPSEWLNAR